MCAEKKKKNFYPQAIQLTVYEREDHWFKMEVGAGCCKDSDM